MISSFYRGCFGTRASISIRRTFFCTKPPRTPLIAFTVYETRLAFRLFIAASTALFNASLKSPFSEVRSNLAIGISTVVCNLGLQSAISKQAHLRFSRRSLLQHLYPPYVPGL